jgi:hypothetical protein
MAGVRSLVEQIAAFSFPTPVVLPKNSAYTTVNHVGVPTLSSIVHNDRMSSWGGAQSSARLKPALEGECFWFFLRNQSRIVPDGATGNAVCRLGKERIRSYARPGNK